MAIEGPLFHLVFPSRKVPHGHRTSFILVVAGAHACGEILARDGRKVVLLRSDFVLVVSVIEAKRYETENGLLIETRHGVRW